ncbi:Conjugal transfer protein [Aliarcobacter thereius]|uniref:TrbG/VirB9 family P-type conjugative transfer protein n=1 Tax=Aliarcobacter thereius TaxID=544718 RepID=UPI000828B47B|nr:TrbG/VirB9 family P-type conjugative transfer protein [Aliarcobacter thereius]OCL86007.1 Conjugal transfer protein [Aliarcobacter thereius]
MKKIFLIILLAINISLANEKVFEEINEEDNKELEKIKEELLKDKKVVIDLNTVQKAFFDIGSEGRTVNVHRYNPKETIKIRCRIFMKSTIILPDGEVPILATTGDNGSFEVELFKESDSKFKLDNVFTVKPNFLGTDTNLTIISASGRVYTFYLYSTGISDRRKPELINYITFDGQLPNHKALENLDEKDEKILSLEEKISELEKKINIEKEDKSIDLTNFNIANTQFDYIFKNELNLEAVFNDNKNTYFKFKDGYSIPKFYYKDDFNNNISVTFSIQKNIIKIPHLKKEWYLNLNGKNLLIKKSKEFEFKEVEKSWLVDMTKTDFSFIYLEKGDEDLKPEAVFHDNEFTFFKFDLSDGFKKLPALFKVLDSYDSPIVNFERIGDFIVAKTVDKSFTLRQGEQHFCIRYKK